jgi:hypothetical protein
MNLIGPDPGVIGLGQLTAMAPSGDAGFTASSTGASLNGLPL